MTLLFFLKPIYHQGPGADDEPDWIPKKKKKKKLTKKFVKTTAQSLELSTVDVKGYIEDILRREDEISHLKEESERQERVKELLEQVRVMVRRSFDAKRKKFNKLLAYILDWL